MIPEHKLPAVQKALQTAFGTYAYSDIKQLTKGLSGALVFKITVGGKPYLLRVITRTDAFGDPTYYYGCMQVAAEHGVAPHIHYMSIEDRVSITDFVVEQPFSIETARQTLPQLLRQLHALPKFPLRNNYFESMEKFLPQFSTNSLLAASEMKELVDTYESIMKVYPKKDVDSWVSCHNDSKFENIVFDGQRPWFVDWESAFLNDRYVDLAVVANFIVHDEQDEAAYLENYFQQPAGEYQQARFFIMQVILHLYYCMFLVVFDKGETPINIAATQLRSFRQFYNGMWDGEISLADTGAKREYALLHLEQFRLKTQTSRFKSSLQVLARHQ